MPSKLPKPVESYAVQASRLRWGSQGKRVHKHTGGYGGKQTDSHSTNAGPSVRQEKEHININFLVWLPLGRPLGLSQGQTGFVPGTNPLCPRDEPRLSPYLCTGSPVCPRDKLSLPLGQPRERRAAEKVYVFKVYVPFSLANPRLQIFKSNSPKIFTAHSCNDGHPKQPLRSFLARVFFPPGPRAHFPSLFSKGSPPKLQGGESWAPKYHLQNEHSHLSLKR